MKEGVMSGKDDLQYFNADMSPAVPELTEELLHFVHFMQDLSFLKVFLCDFRHSTFLFFSI